MSSSQHGHGGSPRSSFASALPETASFYRSSIEATRSSQRFRDANSRAPSVDSTGRSRRDGAAPASTSGGVDDDIAKGLPDDVDAEAASVESGFISSRVQEGHQPSILPSAAFFAPKKGPHARASSPLPMEHQMTDAGMMLGSSGEPEPLGYDGRALGSRNRVDSIRRPPSPFGIASSSSEAGGDQYDRSFSTANGKGIRPGTSRSKSGLLSSQRSQGDFKSFQAATPSRHSMLSTKHGSLSRPQSTIATTSHPSKRDGSTAKESQRGERKYRAHKGSNRFFLFGLVMTSDDNPLPFLASLAYMVALPVLWFVFVAPFTWRHVSPAPVIVFAYVWLVAASSMW